MKAPEVCVEAVDRHLHGVEPEVMREHLQMNRWMLVPGEADEPYLSLLPGLDERFDGAAWYEMKVGIIFVDDLVNLPEIEVIGPEPFERLFELFESGKIKPHVTELEGLDRFTEALDVLNARRSTGKVVIRVAAD